MFKFKVKSIFPQFAHVIMQVDNVTDYSGGRWYWINGVRYNARWFVRV